MNQQLVTDFFKSGKSYGQDMEKNTTRKRSLSLRKSPSKRKLEFDHVKSEEDNEEQVIILSSDEETENKLWLLRNDYNVSQNSLSSDLSDKTLIYSLENNSSREETPVKQECVTETLQSNSNINNTPPLQSNTNSKNTPISQSSSTTSESYQTPVKKSKFYSPNKKRNVLLKSPGRTPKIIPYLSLNRKLFGSEDEVFLKSCEGLDDKTKFLLKIINDFLKEHSLKKFLLDQSTALLSDCFTIPRPGMKLVCRLYWRKEGWYKKEDLQKICAEEKGEAIDEETAITMLDALVRKHILLEGTKEHMSFEECTKILNAEELKGICKSLNIKKQTKKAAVEALEEYSNRKSIVNYFTSPGTKSFMNNSERVVQIMCQKMGKCYRLSDLARSTLERLYILTYLGMDYEIIREKGLEFMLINEKIQRETFPINRNMTLDNASVVFENKEEFDRFLIAHFIYEDFLSLTTTEEKCAIVQQVYNLYKNLDVQHLIRFKSLPLWLQRYTPACIYIKILDSGFQELKKGKNREKCLLVVEILSSLLEQTFREHKKAQWFAEKALVLHSYLNQPEQAAQVLIAGFESNLSEVSKDCMRPRAKKIAQQKNIILDDNIRQTLLAFATKETILEGSIPSHHIYKQPMDNPTKGKALYETKNEFGRTTQGVEDFALSCYISAECFTHGGHWEGRIINTIFFLLFWDIIYSKPKNCSGIFICYYQKYPLDLFCEEFYSNRTEAIDRRLKQIEESTKDEVLELLQAEWNNRPECELSPISRDIGLANLSSVCECLKPRHLAAICRRLATDYRYFHSGFPDLTMWNVHTKQVKFVEVKSDLDKPSMKQIQWMQYLMDNGIETEFCYVGANTTRPKSRKPVKTTDSQPLVSKCKLSRVKS